MYDYNGSGVIRELSSYTLRGYHPRLRVDICPYNIRPICQNRPVRSGASHWCGNDFPSLYSSQSQSKMQCRCATIYGKNLVCSDIISESLFKLFNLGSLSNVSRI